MTCYRGTGPRQTPQPDPRVSNGRLLNYADMRPPAACAGPTSLAIKSRCTLDPSRRQDHTKRRDAGRSRVAAARRSDGCRPHAWSQGLSSCGRKRYRLHKVGSSQKRRKNGRTTRGSAYIIQLPSWAAISVEVTKGHNRRRNFRFHSPPAKWEVHA